MKQQTFIVFIITCILLVPSSLGIFGLSGTHTLQEQGPIRDNALAEEAEVTSTFSTTFPRDIMYYPDTMLTDPLFATDGDSGFDNTYAVDGSYFPVTLGTEILEFHVDNNSITGIEYFSYAVYGQSGDETALYYADAEDGPWTEYFVLVDEPTLEWHNGTEYDVSTLSDIAASETFYIYFDFTSNIDYIEITFAYMMYSSKTDILTDPLFATDGDSGFDNTYAVDGSYFPVTLGTEILEFDYTSEYPIEYFSYAVYGNSTDYVALYYADAEDGPWTEYFVLVDEPTLEWYNGTEYDVSTLSDIAASETFYIYFDFNSLIDYIEITFCYMILGENTYTESFVDVSEWDITQGTFTSDNDVATITRTAGIYAYAIANLSAVTDLTGYYYEYYISEGIENYQIQIRNASDSTLFTQGWASGTGLQKGFIPSAVDAFRIWFFCDDSQGPGDEWAKLDYLRISPSDETGWQQDGSTTSGVTVENGALVSSDGNILTITNDASSQIRIYPDTTSTACYIDTSYYQLLEVNFHSDSIGSDFALEGFDGDYDTIQIRTTISKTSYRYNLAVALDNNLRYFRFYFYDNDIIKMRSIQAYSIANYTVTQSSTTTNDYLYIENGILYSNINSGSITLDYDPAFLLDGSYSWVKSTSLGDSYLSFLHIGWKPYTSDTTGTLVGSTTTDFRIMFNASANIIDIQYFPIPPQWHSFTMELIYFDMPNWHMFTMEDIIIYIPINELTISYLLMLGGLVMIPTSTVLLVKGGRSEMSKDKLFLFLLMFLFGWALFLGGIL